MKVLMLIFLSVTTLTAFARPKTEVDCVSLQDPLYRIEIYIDSVNGQGITFGELTMEEEVLISDSPLKTTFGSKYWLYQGRKFSLRLDERPDNSLRGTLIRGRGRLAPQYYECEKLR